MRRAVLLALALWLVGCAPGTAPEPPAPQPTPATPSSPQSEDARQPAPTVTAEARPDSVEQLTDRLVAGLAADLPGWPSRNDYELVVLPFYDDRPGFSGRRTGRLRPLRRCLRGRRMPGRPRAGPRRIQGDGRQDLLSRQGPHPQDSRRSRGRNRSHPGSRPAEGPAPMPPHASAPTSPLPPPSRPSQLYVSPAQSSPPICPTCSPGRSTPRPAR